MQTQTLAISYIEEKKKKKVSSKDPAAKTLVNLFLCNYDYSRTKIL